MSFTWGRAFAKCLGGASIATASLYAANKFQGQSERFTVLARDATKENFLHEGFNSKWNSNWDLRDPKSLVKPLNTNASDDEKEEHEKQVADAKPKANRIIVMVRHGQYNLKGATDDER